MFAIMAAVQETTQTIPETVTQTITQSPVQSVLETTADIVTSDVFINHMEVIENWLVINAVTLAVILGFLAGVTLFRWLK